MAKAELKAKATVWFIDGSYATFDTTLIDKNKNGFFSDDGSPSVYTPFATASTLGFEYVDQPTLELTPPRRLNVTKVEYSGLAIDYIKLTVGNTQSPTVKVSWSFNMTANFRRHGNQSAPYDIDNARITTVPRPSLLLDEDIENNYTQVPTQPDVPDTECPRTPTFNSVSVGTNYTSYPIGVVNMASVAYPH